MGYFAHHALIVTGRSRDEVVAAHSEAVRILGTWERVASGAVVDPDPVQLLSPVSDYIVNGGASWFVMFPDGSKEGWQESDEGDRCRAEIVAALEANSSCDYAVIRFGGDEPDTARIEAHNK